MKFVAAKCPSCGANIEVEPNSDRTKCEYCKTQIIVEDAIAKLKVELSGEVEIKNLPKLEDYLKNANRNYENGNFADALKYYEKVLELEPDSYIAVLLCGICKSMVSIDYNFNWFLDGLKDSCQLLGDEPTKEEYDFVAHESYTANEYMENALKKLYDDKKCNKDDMNILLLKQLDCLGLYMEIETIASIINEKFNDSELLKQILKSEIELADYILKGKKYKEKKSKGKKETVIFIPPRKIAEGVSSTRNKAVEKYNKLVDEKEKVEMKHIPFIRMNGTIGQFLKHTIIILIVVILIIFLIIKLI